MALIAPGICRYSVIGRLEGQLIVNVFDIQIDTTGGGETRGEAIFQVAGDVLNNWSDHILNRVSGEYVAEEVRWVDLDSADGQTGSRSSTSDNTWPAPGENLGGALTNNTCALVTKVLEGKARNQRNGMTRLAGIPGGQLASGNANALSPAAVTSYSQGFNAFLVGVNDTEGPVIGVQRNLVVVHTVDGEYTSFSRVQEFICRPGLGTIRRRMPGYGE